ncbi:restriction endonuclease subunit S [Flavobacterium laiguense]|uniref:Restriction endonuclease subunit S n=1 Tax=Flavobacterium laiguense TaxID=2169409 RepID=A0A2U1JQW7_9FLAO|nr:restriction endonuclease subunit S [Flavobacterium laiguense]PWA07551.1 restriction endonuclease subunit S [Flavobacterium laiguense]
MKKYDSYKDSGIEYIGEIPEHWKVKKTFHHFKAEKGKKAALLTKEYCGTIEGNFPVYSGQTENNGIMSLIKEYEFDFREDGCLLSTTVGAKAMSISYLRGKFSLSQNCMIITSRNKNEINNRFFFYQFQPIFKFHRGLIPDHMQPSFRMDDLYQFKIIIPSKIEQTKIANFLDHKTTQIDSLISKKEQFITLLQEERIAVINQTVTKGLDPKVNMKDSGIEWLGEIPEHWEVKKLKYVGNCQNGVSEGAEFFGTGHPFVSYGDVYKNVILPNNVIGLANSNEKHQEHYSVEESDIFFTRTSETIEEIGIASICYNTIEKAVFAGFLIRFRPNKEIIIKEFSKYYFRCFIPRTFFVKEMNLVTRASLSQELLKRLPVLLPSIKEQKEIAFYLDKKTNEIDSIISKSQQEIELLKEYKTALISEVVTGKVDVRDVVLN